MTMGSPLAAAAASPGVDEMNAICFPSGDQTTDLPVSGTGELLPLVAARKVVPLPSGCAMISPPLSLSAPLNAIHLLSADHTGLPAGLFPPNLTLLPLATSMTHNCPEGLPGCSRVTMEYAM